MVAAVAVAPKAVAVKVAGQPVLAVAKGTAVGGQVERAAHPAEGAAMHRLAVAKSSFGAELALHFCNEGTSASSACGFSSRFRRYGAPSGQRLANRRFHGVSLSMCGVLLHSISRRSRK